MNSTKSSRIYYTKPSITEREIAYVNDAVTNGWGERCYEYIDRFEKALGAHLAVKHVIATSSCTGALHMGLAALDIGPGDEVILADINWIASAAPITYLGAKPVFVDILADSWCLDPAEVEKAINENTKAIIAVHLYGNLCDMDALLDIGRRHGIPIIEDAAEAIGSVWHGHKAGTMGEFGSFSFHGTKTITTGEGGAFVTNNTDLYEKVLTLSNHGRKRGEKKQFWPERIGFKYKMSNLQAAVGLAQAERIEELVARKRSIFQHYAEAFKNLLVTMNPEPTGTVNGYWMPTIVFSSDVDLDRAVLIEVLKTENIDARVFFWPLSMMDAFQGRSHNENAYHIYRNAINLPSYHDISDDDLHRVTNCIRAVIRRQR